MTATDTAGLNATKTVTVTALSNLVGNAGFETDTSGWVASGGTLQRVSGGHTGSWSAALSNAGTKKSTVTLDDSPNWVTTTSPGTSTASLWVRADSPGATLKLTITETKGKNAAGSTSANIKLSTTWQQVTVQYKPSSPGSSTLSLTATVANAAPGRVFYADDVVITKT
jgi:hypothetical protein